MRPIPARRWRYPLATPGASTVPFCFIRDQALYRFSRDPAARRPFEGLRLLDIGCGGGLLCEPMTRLGFAVTGVDASERNIGTASAHAAQQGLEIDYRASTAEALLAAGEPPFDLILNMEVIEHVADPGAFLCDCAKLLKPGGLMVLGLLATHQSLLGLLLGQAKESGRTVSALLQDAFAK